MQDVEPAEQTLQAEVNFYRQNHAILETEIKTLIEDNKKLSRQIESLLRERAVWAARASGHQQTQQDELHNQITLLTKERESLLQLWQTSQRTIEALDTELKTYQSERDQFDGDKTRKNIENTRADFDIKFNTALEEINTLEKKIHDATSKEKSLTIELKAKENEIIVYQERGKALEERIKETVEQIEDLKTNLAIEKNNNQDILKEVEKSKSDVDLATKREAEAKLKVREALDLLDLVTIQRDDACAKAIAASEELVLLKSSINEVTREIEGRLRSELDEVKEKYDEKISDMLTHVQALDRELVEKGLLLAKTLRENKVLKKAVQHFEKLREDAVSSVDPRLVIAGQKLDAAFQELVLSERRNIQLVSEKQCLALEVARLSDAHARDVKRREWEATLLRTEIADLKLQIEHLQKSLTETDGMVTKLQGLLSSKTDLNHRMVSSKEEEVTALNEHIQKQIELNKKWRQSYVEMTEQLKKRLNDLHEENKRLKSQRSPHHEDDQKRDHEMLKLS